MLYLSAELQAGQLQPYSTAHGQHAQQFSATVTASALDMHGIVCPAAAAWLRCLNRQQCAVPVPQELQMSSQQPAPRELQVLSSMVPPQCLVYAALFWLRYWCNLKASLALMQLLLLLLQEVPGDVIQLQVQRRTHPHSDYSQFVAGRCLLSFASQSCFDIGGLFSFDRLHSF